MSEILSPAEHEFRTAMLSRQQPLLGETGARRLEDAVVAHAGLGGGGALTLELLARAGIRRFRLLDRDCYEPSNLNRQVFATAATVGRPKVEVAAERLQQINPFVVIEKSFHAPVSLANAEEMVDGADILMVCTDSPSSHILFQQVARRRRVRVVMGAAPALSCGVWTLPFEQPERRRGPVSLLRSWIGRVRGTADIFALSEQEALALDGTVNPPGGFTPTISFVPNCSACLAAALAINYISGRDPRPRALTMDFHRFRSVGPVAHALATLKRAVTG